MTEIRFDTRGGRKKALILVPHQDDELNASMNLLLWLKKAGIETYVAYSTNGDWRFSVDRRYAEAVSVCAKLGIGRDHVIFLGYGDWLNSEKHDHLFYADEVPAVSPAGFSHTYGGKQVRDLAYSLRNEHSPYTFPAFCRDISLLVETFLPDLIVCTDLDEHADHRALSLAFDKVMGEILKKRDDYHPQVLKRFAYCTAYAAEADFYEGGAVPETKRPRTGKTEKYAFDLVGSLY